MSRKHRIASVLKRFQFIDLARAVSARGPERVKFLEAYVDRSGGPYSTYSPFRSAIAGICGVSLGLDPSAPGNWPSIESAIRRSCKGRDEAMNLDAAKCMFDVVQNDDMQAYFIPQRSLPLGTDRACRFGIEHYLVRGDKAVFQFPYPRRTRLSVEIADLSVEKPYIYTSGRREPAPRVSRIIRLAKANVISREILEPEISDIYRVLMELAAAPE